jgi:hypothetical protein
MSDSEENDSEVEVPVKKRPGRPKKQIPKKPMKKFGIVSEPTNKLPGIDPRMQYVMELWYDNPIMFKKIFGLCQTMSIDNNIRVRFEKDQVKMYTIDHSGKNKIYIRIFGKSMTRYYCGRDLEIGLNPTMFQKMLQTLNKSYGQIIFASRKQYEKTKIRLIFINDEIEESSEHDVDVEAVDAYDWAVEDELARENDYPIKFELTSKHFKKKVNDSKMMTDILRIEKDGEGPLRFSYNFKNKKGVNNSILKNANKINLQSKLDPMEMFSTSVFLEHIKPLAGALVSDTIQISADTTHNLIFTSLLDQDEVDKKKIPGTEKCEIKIITEIVDKRKLVTTPTA